MSKFIAENPFHKLLASKFESRDIIGYEDLNSVPESERLFMNHNFLFFEDTKKHAENLSQRLFLFVTK